MIGVTAATLVLAATFAEAQSDTSCIVMDAPVSGRLSPLDSVSFDLRGYVVKLCFSRPSARGRIMIGGKDVPYGELWRTGANEPTMLHTTGAISIAGIEIGSGSYSLYTIPGEEEWVILINSSITQWGHIAEYDYRVRRQEVGRGRVPRERTQRHVETMTFSVESVDGEAIVFLEWERTRIAIPIVLADDESGGRR